MSPSELAARLVGKGIHATIPPGLRPASVFTFAPVALGCSGDMVSAPLSGLTAVASTELGGMGIGSSGIAADTLLCAAEMDCIPASGATRRYEM